MNRIIVLLSALFITLGASAATDATLDKIQKANSSLKTVECAFAQTKTLQAAGKIIRSAGQLYFTSDGQLSMQYSKPEGEALIINGKQVCTRRGGKKMVFNTDKNQQMNALSLTLIGCIEGRARDVAEANAADVSVKDMKDGYVVTISARAASPRGYSKIILNYRHSDCTLVRMEMVEFAGVQTVYEMSDIRKGVNVPQDKFAIPAK